MRVSALTIKMANLKRPITQPKKIFLTSKGLEEAKTELNFLKKTKRQELIETIKQARDFGDIADSADYSAALEEQSFVEDRIEELERIIHQAKILDHPPDINTVSVGSTVKVKIGNDTEEYTIVSKVEADPAKKMISNESPLGSSLIGASVGQEVEVKTPSVHYKCKILAIS